jgi:hypothetical protein
MTRELGGRHTSLLAANAVASIACCETTPRQPTLPAALLEEEPKTGTARGMLALLRPAMEAQEERGLPKQFSDGTPEGANAAQTFAIESTRTAAALRRPQDSGIRIDAGLSLSVNGPESSQKHKIPRPPHGQEGCSSSAARSRGRS